MQNEKRIIIIGAGVAGLSAGIYAEQHGSLLRIIAKTDVALLSPHSKIPRSQKAL